MHHERGEYASTDMCDMCEKPMSLTGDNFGVGAGEGRAAVCGHQSGDQGVRVEIPVFSSGDRSHRASIVPLPGTNSVLVNR